MPSIVATTGTIPCTFLRGTVNDSQMRVEIEQEPGRNGYIAVLAGKGKSEMRKTAILIAYDAVTGSYTNSLAAVLAWALSIKKLSGKVVSIIDDWGELASPDVSEDDLLVTEVMEPRKQRFANSSTNGPGIKIEVDFVCVQRE